MTTKRQQLEEAIEALRRNSRDLKKEPISQYGLNSSTDRLDHMRQNRDNEARLREMLRELDQKEGRSNVL